MAVFTKLFSRNIGVARIFWVVHFFPKKLTTFFLFLFSLVVVLKRWSKMFK